MGNQGLNDEVLERDDKVSWWWVLAAAAPKSDDPRAAHVPKMQVEQEEPTTGPSRFAWLLLPWGQHQRLPPPAAFSDKCRLSVGCLVPSAWSVADAWSSSNSTPPRWRVGNESFTWPQPFRPDADGQHEPPQQQLVLEHERPRQKSFRLPLGQIQAQWGALANSVVPAVSQMKPTWIVLCTHFIVSFSPVVHLLSRWRGLRLARLRATARWCSNHAIRPTAEITLQYSLRPGSGWHKSSTGPIWLRPELGTELPQPRPEFGGLHEVLNPT